MAEQDLQDLEQAAKYRPGAVSQIANLLTGGLYGMASGTTQKSVDAERARQALFQENLSNRLMQRRRMESLLDQAADFGIPKQEAQKLVSEDPALLANRMNQIKMRQTLSQETGRQMGLAGEQGPIQTQTPMEGQAFSLGQLSGQAERFKEERDLDEATKTATALGIPVPQGATSSAIRSLIGQQQGMVAQREAAEISKKSQADAAKAFLQEEGEEVPQDGPAAIARMNKIKAGALTRTQQAQKRNLQDFEDAYDSGDVNNVKSAYNQLTPQDRKNPDIQQKALALGVKVFTLPPKDMTELRKAANRDRHAVTAANAIQALVGARDLEGVSQMSFNQLKRWADDNKNRQFMRTPEGNAIARVIQNYEQLIKGERKDISGASLTGSELESSRISFGDQNKADFLGRAMDHIDSIFQNNTASEFDRQGFMVPKSFLEDAEKARSKWNQVSSGIKGWKSQYAPIEGSVGAAGAAPSGTNAPAAGKTGSGKSFKIISD